MSEMLADVPSGFEPIFRSSPFTDMLGPLYCKGRGTQLSIGMRVQAKHTNNRGKLHAGALSTLADVALGYSMSTSTDPPTSMVTANLSIDFAAGAKPGDWIETRSDVQKVGARMAFANVYFHVGDERIARASGVFLVVAPTR